MRTVLGVLVLACLAVASGCSDDGNGSAESASGATPTAAPFTLRDTGGEAGEFSYCLEHAGTRVEHEQITPTRAVVLSTPELVGGNGATITGSWIAAVPAGATPLDGAVIDVVPTPSSEIWSTWKHRTPMAGTALSAGVTYTLFTQIELQPGSNYDAIDFGWTADKTTGVVTKDQVVRHAAHCS